MRKAFAISVLLFAIVAAFSITHADMRPPPALNPKDYKSPSGKFALHVDPSDMYGRGPAAYRVTRDGKVVWSGEKPFTLYEAGITDNGIVGGYAYTHGLAGFGRTRADAGLGQFHVVIISPTGELILDELIERTHSRFLHEFPNPAAKALLVDGRNNQMIVVISDEDVNRRQDRRWTYQLSSGRLLSKSTSGPNISPASPPAERQPPSPPVFPTQALKQLGTFALGDAKPAAAPPIRDITCFDFDDRGRIGFIRRDDRQKNTFVLTSPDGKILHETTAGIPNDDAKTWKPEVAWLSGDQWIIVVSELGVGAKASAWKLDVSGASFEPLPAFDSPAISAIVRLPDGGFVVLATRRFKYTMEDNLIAFDQAGKSRWHIKRGQHDVESALFSPKDVTVTSSAKIAVIDGIRHKVQFFSTNGSFLDAINLEKAWGRKPNYLAAITADKDDGILIEDFRGSPPVIRMNAQGKVIAEFVPKHPDGRIIDTLRGLRVDPFGRIWACDGDALIRLRDDGIADLVLGDAPSAEKINKVAAVTVDQTGHLYAMDDRSGAVHVFDHTGSRLRVCKPDVTDFSNQIWNAQLAVMPDGTVFANSDTTRFVHFAPDGQRVGIKHFALGSVTQQWHPLPDGKRILILGYHDAFIVDREGELIRTIQRRPDRTWLELPQSASVAPDGSFAVMTEGKHFSRKPWQVHLYTAAGDPVRTIKMPPTCVESCFAYTGKLLATRTDRDICLFTPTGDPVSKFTPTLDGFADVEKQRWQCFSTFAGRELWYICPERKSVARFELPE